MTTSESLDVYVGNWEELPSLKDIKTTRRNKSSFRTKLQDSIDSIFFQSFIVLLVLFDLILGLTTIIADDKTNSIITLVIIVIYCIEISVRIYAYGLKKYFTSILDIIDFVAVLGSLVLYIYNIIVVYALLVKILRWIRVIRTTYRALFSRASKIRKAIRQLTRSRLKGYRDAKYDLDLCYLTDNILIMSKPSRNAINQFAKDALSDVKQFLDEKHKDSYRIYDLCVYDDVGSDADDKKENMNSNESIQLDVDKSNSNLNNISALSIFPVNIDITDGPNVEYDTFGATQIMNEFAFRGNTVLSVQKIFEFAEEATRYSDASSSNVIIVQSTSGLGRCMFMTACLLFYYYPTAALSEIITFIHKERVSIAERDATDANKLFDKFLPSQARYIRYFATLISHCYRLFHDDDDDDDDAELTDVERHLSHHIQHIHQQTLDKDLIINLHVADPESKWNFYHKTAIEMLRAKIGVVIKHIVVHNYFDEIDPYVNWEADIFKWKEFKDDDVLANDDDRLRCVEYEQNNFGIDSKPGKNSALIKKLPNSKSLVLEQDFGIRVYKSVGNTDEDRDKTRKLMAQLILHSHFINLDDDQCIKFNKNEIDFVNKDVNHKHFPQDFHIIIKAKILRKKV